MIDRIKSIQEYSGLTPTQFADKIELNRSNLTHIYSGRNHPSLDVVKKILKTFPELNSDWLLMGDGEMLAGASSPKQFSLFNESEISDEEKKRDQGDDLPPSLEKSELKLPPKKVKEKTIRESRRSTVDQAEIQIIKSQGEKKIERIVIFYDDQTFSIYHPE